MGRFRRGFSFQFQLTIGEGWIMTDETHEGPVGGFLIGLLVGAALGAGVALLTAPTSGRRARRRIRRAADDLRESATDRFEEISQELRDRVDEVLDLARGE